MKLMMQQYVILITISNCCCCQVPFCRNQINRMNNGRGEWGGGDGGGGGSLELSRLAQCTNTHTQQLHNIKEGGGAKTNKKIVHTRT